MTEKNGQGSRLEDDPPALTLRDLLAWIAAHLGWLVAGPVIGMALGVGVSFLVTPQFTSRTSFLPPQQAQSAANAAIASLGSLAGLPGVGQRTPADQFVALLQSTTLSDRIIDKFELQAVYDEKYRIDTRRQLARNVRVTLGKKDGLIHIDVMDESPQRAADMANRYVEELRQLISTLALTEAQQRRKFFEEQVAQTRQRLTQAEQELQASGFSSGALRAEPRAAAESFARLKAEVVAAEVRLNTLRRSLTDAAPEVQQQLAALISLRAELARSEATDASAASPGYIARYREFKYQEALFDQLSRQFELARIDESKENGLIQVIDAATPAEKKALPKRSMFVVGGAFSMLGAVLAYLLGRRLLRPLD